MGPHMKSDISEIQRSTNVLSVRPSKPASVQENCRPVLSAMLY
jgi:hypothetical protein